jgi:Fe2+ or Zn2+ uptake regulation protein
VVNLPRGYTAQVHNLVISGTCSACA